MADEVKSTPLLSNFALNGLIAVIGGAFGGSLLYAFALAAQAVSSTINPVVYFALGFTGVFMLVLLLSLKK